MIARSFAIAILPCVLLVGFSVPGAAGNMTAQQANACYVGFGAQKAAMDVFVAGKSYINDPRHEHADSLDTIAWNYMNAHGKDLHGEPLGSIAGTVPRIEPSFMGCAFRDRCGEAAINRRRPVSTTRPRRQVPAALAETAAPRWCATANPAAQPGRSAAARGRCR